MGSAPGEFRYEFIVVDPAEPIARKLLGEYFGEVLTVSELSADVVASRFRFEAPGALDGGL